MNLTARQQEIYDFIKKYWNKYGYPPTVREIGKAVGLTSSSTVHTHLANLEKYGILRRDPSKPRALELLIEKAREIIPGPTGLPLVGSVAAGEPILAEENVEEYVEVPAFMKRDKGEFLLKVRGDSMIKAGILDRDYVVVEPKHTARNGEIVVAMVGEEEATVKRFFKENGHVRLQPENDELEPIITIDVTVVGSVTGVLRSVA